MQYSKRAIFVLAICCVLLHLPTISCAAGCPYVVCSTTLGEKECYSVATDPPSVKSCPANYVCTGAGAEGCKLAFPTTLLMPGTRTTKDDDCITGTSKDGYCRGVAVGQACAALATDAAEPDFLENAANSFIALNPPTSLPQAPITYCDLGLYCTDDKVCAKMKATGEQCAKDAECTHMSRCINNKCVLMYSLAVGQESTYGDMCVTGYAYNGRCVSILDGPAKFFLTNEEAPKDACLYNGAAIAETATCISFSGNKQTTGYCYDRLKLPSIVSVFKKYVTAVTNNDYLFTRGSITDLQMDKMSNADRKEFLDAYLYYTTQMETTWANCVQKTAELVRNRYPVSYSHGLTAGLLTLVVALFLLL